MSLPGGWREPRPAAAAAAAGRPARKQSGRDPWSFCSWNGSSSFAGGGHHAQLTARVSQKQPGCGHVQ